MNKYIMKKAGYLIIVLVLVSLIAIFLFGHFNQPDIEKPVIIDTYEVVLLPEEEITAINSNFNTIEETDEPIKINDVTFSQEKTKEELADELVKSEYRYFILQFIGPIEDGWKEILEKMNVEFFDYIPEYSFKVWIHPTQIPEILKLDFVHNIIEYNPELKIVPAAKIMIEDASTWEKIKLVVTLFETDEYSTAVIKKYSSNFLEADEKTFYITIRKSNLDKILELPNIDTVEELKEVDVTNDYSADIMETEPIWIAFGLNGAGQQIGIIDSGVDTGVDNLTLEGDVHYDLDNRLNSITLISNEVCQFYGQSCTSADDINGHGTHTAGSIAGNATNSSGIYRGMAYAANLSVYATGDDAGSTSVYLSNVETMIQVAYDDGARIHSNSWGSGTTEYSNALAKRADSFMWDNKDMLIVMSAGNDGSSLQTVRDPGTAKNVLTVGASQSNRSGSGYGTDINTVVSFSSRGPANDNRTKPDVVSPGTNIISTKSRYASLSCASGAYDGNYSTCSGTSMSTPLTAGMAALVRQNFELNLGYDGPTSALIKAFIINGAQDIGYGIQSNHTGWGRVNLTNTIFPTYPKYFKYIDNKTGFSSSGQSDLYTFDVINDTVPLKITLVWTDFESSASASTNLVNDLDLVVTSPNGSVYYGNNFYSPYNTSQDRLNNVEQLLLYDNASAVENGTYTINISAFSISQANQDYSLVISGALNVSPTATKYDGDTTDFGTVQALYNTTTITLENTTHGKIFWNDYVYLGEMNFDDNILFGKNNVWANATGLHNSLVESNVTISLYNLSFAEPMALKDGDECTGCDVITRSEGLIEFYTVGFSNYSSAENSSIEIWDQLDTGKPNATSVIYQNETIYFFANYTNYTSSLPITTGTCNATFNDTATVYTLSYNDATYYYSGSRTFDNPDDFEYNISCSAVNFFMRNASNTTGISDMNAVYPWMPTNLSIVDNGNNSITLTWNTTEYAGSYGLFYDSNVSLLWKFDDSSVPNVTDITGLSYTDTTIGFSERYYKIVALNSTSRTNASNETLGVFIREIKAATGSPSTGVELNLFMLPLNVTNTSLDAIAADAADNDIIYTYNSTTGTVLSSQFFSGYGWFGNITFFEIDKAYVFKPVLSKYNLTMVGIVPTTNATITIKNSSNIAGNTTDTIEFNLIGLNTPQQKCDLDLIFYGAVSGDSIFRYNILSAVYQTATYDGAEWSGDFDCINAGEGYELRNVASDYILNYER